MRQSWGSCGEHILREIYQQHGQECKKHYFRCPHCFKKGIPVAEREEHLKASTHTLFLGATDERLDSILFYIIAIVSGKKTSEALAKGFTMSKAVADTIHGSQNRLIPASSVPANITGGIWRDLYLGQCRKDCPGIFSMPGISRHDSKLNIAPR